jgi:hypothetical protein
LSIYYDGEFFETIYLLSEMHAFIMHGILTMKLDSFFSAVSGTQANGNGVR